MYATTMDHAESCNALAVASACPSLECAICFDPLQDASSLVCGHSFCYPCIVQHFEREESCPCCRRRNHHSTIIPNLALREVVSEVQEYVRQSGKDKQHLQTLNQSLFSQLAQLKTDREVSIDKLRDDLSTYKTNNQIKWKENNSLRDENESLLEKIELLKHAQETSQARNHALEQKVRTAKCDNQKRVLEEDFQLSQQLEQSQREKKDLEVQTRELNEQLSKLEDRMSLVQNENNDLRPSKEELESRLEYQIPGIIHLHRQLDNSLQMNNSLQNEVLELQEKVQALSIKSRSVKRV